MIRASGLDAIAACVIGVSSDPQLQHQRKAILHHLYHHHRNHSSSTSVVHQLQHGEFVSAADDDMRFNLAKRCSQVVYSDQHHSHRRLDSWRMVLQSQRREPGVCAYHQLPGEHSTDTQSQSMEIVLDAHSMVLLAHVG